MMNIVNIPVEALPVFDYDDFLERMDGDMDLLREVIEIFLEDAPSLMGALRLAIRGGNKYAMERAAHTLKGAAANISAKGLRSLSGKMQEMIKKGEVTQIEKLLKEMETHYEELDRALRSHLTAKA
jgi:HPt (histidine-containing phosphotransfer) domain-containing protein